MKIKEGFVIQQVGGQWIAVATGKTAKEFGGIVKLNDTAALVWKGLEEGLSEQEIVARMVGEYDVTEQKAADDLRALCDKLLAAGIAQR